MAFYIVDADGNYVPVPTVTGANGKNAIMRVSNGYLQWKNDDTKWQNLVAMSTLKGDTGESGSDGQEVSLRVQGTILQWKLGTGNWQNLMDLQAYSTIQIGTVTTGDAGSDANVTNSGTSTAAVLNFTIPRGAKGDPGDMSKTVYDTTNRNEDIFLYVDSHIDDDQNPHNVTPSQIGAASSIHTHITSTTASLTVAEWSSLKQTVNVTGLTASDVVIVSPSPTQIANWSKWGVYASAQVNGSLTFTCTTTPTSALTAQILIMR